MFANACFFGAPIALALLAFFLDDLIDVFLGSSTRRYEAREIGSRVKPLLWMFAVVSPVLVRKAFFGFPEASMHRELGETLREACVRDERLYHEFVESGIFRLRVVPIGK
jgi:hypothetical protein